MVRFTRRPRSNRPGATVSLGRPGVLGGFRSRLRGSNPYLPRLTSQRRRPAVSRRHAGTKRDPRRVMNIAPGVGGQSGAQFRFRPDRKCFYMEKVGANNTYSVNYAQRLNVLDGFQNAIGLDTASNNVLRAIMGTTPIGADNTLNQYALKNSLNVMQIANNSTSGAHIDIYDIVYKRNMPLSWTATDGSVYGTPDAVQAWQIGMQAQDQASSVDAWKNLMVTPGASRTFNDYCKIIKRTRLLLGAGSTHEHRSTATYNKLVSTSVIGANGLVGSVGNNQVYLTAGFAHTTMVVAYGSPASSRIEGFPDVVVSTAPLAIDVVYQAQYNFTWVNDKQNTTNIVDNLVTFAPGTAANIAPAYINAPIVFSTP